MVWFLTNGLQPDPHFHSWCSSLLILNGNLFVMWRNMLNKTPQKTQKSSLFIFCIWIAFVYFFFFLYIHYSVCLWHLELMGQLHHCSCDLTCWMLNTNYSPQQKSGQTYYVTNWPWLCSVSLINRCRWLLIKFRALCSLLIIFSVCLIIVNKMRTFSVFWSERVCKQKAVAEQQNQHHKLGSDAGSETSHQMWLILINTDTKEGDLNGLVLSNQQSTAQKYSLYGPLRWATGINIFARKNI